jgi:putative intracellular protease/amidase
MSRRNLAIIAAALLFAAIASVTLIVWGRGENGPEISPAPPTANGAPRRLLLLLPSRGLWFPDYQQLVDAVRSASHGTDVELVVAGPSLEPAELEPTSPTGTAKAEVQLGSQLNASDFDAILFLGYDTSEFGPGGAAASETARLLAEFQRDGKTIAALCAGQRALLENGVVRGKRIAPCRYVERADVAAQGAMVGERNVERDGQIVTAASDADAPALIAAILISEKP